MKINFRDSSPSRRSGIKHRSNYRDYKSDLAKDFNRKCGYTNCSDFWFGGQGCFHIDHFKPWKKFPNQPSLKTDYNNLVYCCSYVNILKSDDLGNYLDPCNVDYNIHFQRDLVGVIIPVSQDALYMYKKMKLYMERYRIIWMLDQLLDKKAKLKKIIESTDNAKAKDLYMKLSFEFDNYLTYLKANQ